jgi:predicted ester cyclase
MANVELFQKIIERSFNRSDLTVAGEICAPVIVAHEYFVATDLSSPEILKTQIQKARDEVIDLKLTIEDLVVSGTKVWARSHACGKSKSGKNVAFMVFDVCRFDQGKLVEHWRVSDRFAALHQSDASLLAQDTRQRV